MVAQADLVKGLTVYRKWVEVECSGHLPCGIEHFEPGSIEYFIDGVPSTPDEVEAWIENHGPCPGFDSAAPPEAHSH